MQIDYEEQSDEGEMTSTDEGESASEGSDYEVSRPATTAPPKKRTKLVASKGKKKQCLSMLLTMPLDILFEIFSQLSSKDIIHLSRTSKLLRGTLMTRNATTIWKRARERVNAPDCPNWLSEPAWACLLFGHTCQSCGASNIQLVEFLLLMRICTRCKKTHYVPQMHFQKYYPEVDLEVLDLLSGTHQSWNRSYHDRKQKYYWDGDVRAVIKSLASLADDVSKGIPNAPKLLLDYKEEQKFKVREIKEKSKEWTTWLTNSQMSRNSEAIDAMDCRLQQIKEKFKELGYIDADLQFLRFKKECQQQAQVSERIWKRIRPLLEPEIQERKKVRLLVEMEALRGQRRRILERCYLKYRRCLSASQWKYMPTASEIEHYEAFTQIIDADSNAIVTESTFDEVFENFPELHASAVDKRRESLRSLLPELHASAVDKRWESLRSLLPDFAQEDGEVSDPLDLATAVFQCQGANALHHLSFVFGWQDIISHHCVAKQSGWSSLLSEFRVGTPQLEHSPHAAKVVEKLAILSGLDPAFATAADLDQKNLRYSCTACGELTTHVDIKYRWRAAFTWRTMVEHLGHPTAHNPTVDVVILSSAQANETMEYESESHSKLPCWTCGRCPEHLDRPQPRVVVLQHLVTFHNISIPQEPSDLFFFERYKMAFVTKPVYRVGAQTETQKINSNDLLETFRCLLCTGVKESKRCFKLLGVKDHIRVKHAIPSPEDGPHYLAYSG